MTPKDRHKKKAQYKKCGICGLTVTKNYCDKCSREYDTLIQKGIK